MCIFRVDSRIAEVDEGNSLMTQVVVVEQCETYSDMYGSTRPQFRDDPWRGSLSISEIS